MTTEFKIRCLDKLGPDEINGLADVLISCVEGGASVGFMLPMPLAKAVAFWTTIAASVERGERLVFVAEDQRGEIQGTVQVVLNMPENQPHRGDIAKMLVHTRARKHGLGSALLEAAEFGARNFGKTVLVLDTVTGGDAERMYARKGWIKVGPIPNYALMPDGPLCSTTYFYKSLV